MPRWRTVNNRKRRNRRSVSVSIPPTFYSLEYHRHPSYFRDLITNPKIIITPKPMIFNQIHPAYGDDQ